MKKRIKVLTIFLVAILALTACQQTDVIGNTAKTSFSEVVKAIPEQITSDEENVGWSLTAPDNTARFIWSKDYSKSPIYDAMIEFDVTPFLDAGLDVGKLPQGIIFGDKIILGTKFGNDEPEYVGEATPEESFNQIVTLYRGSIGYHEAMDHYGIDLESGNKFEWAKDMKKNDKDIVFVVDPQMFVEAGVNPEQVEGWVYAPVEMMDLRGKKTTENKFLKPFDLQKK